MKRPDQRKGSQWRAQLGALRLDRDAASDPAAAAERARLADLALPGLSLPARLEAPKRRVLWAASSALGLLAGVAVAVLVWPAPEDPWRSKGGANVRVYWERAGAVRALEPATELRDGDRLRAEVDAGSAGVAYWLVTDGAGKALVDAAFVRDSAVTLKPGGSVPFAKSVQIVGPPSGEVLHVVVCASAAGIAEDSPEGLLAQPGCVDRPFALRRGR